MIKAIVAIDKNTKGIGYKNALPWKLKSDLQFFKEMTKGKVVIMGYNTMLSLGEPLIDRTNIVIAKHDDRSKNIPDGFTIIYDHQVKDLLSALSRDGDEVWVIGGAKTYSVLEDIIDEWYIVSVEGDGCEYDTYLDINLKGLKIDSKRSLEVNDMIPQPDEEYPKYERLVYVKCNPLDKFDLTPRYNIEKLNSLIALYQSDFIKIFGPLLNIVSRRNIYVGEYHSDHHLIGCAYLAFLFGADNDKGFRDIDFVPLDGLLYDRYSKRTIIRTLAMLFHDYCYLGEKEDLKNIVYSWDKMKELIKSDSYLFEEICRFFNITTMDLTRIVSHQITYTFYDFNNPYPEGPTLQTDLLDFHFLRDIDQLYASVYFDEQMFNRLYEDIGKRFSLTREEFIDRNLSYCENIKLTTPVLKEMYETVLPLVMIDHHQLSNIKS